MSENGKLFDLIIIGSGPGGYVAAIRGAQLGMNVACVETEKLGGVCLNVGCIPTKALLSSALFVQEMKRAEGHGVTIETASVSLGPAQERSRKVADQLNKGVGHLFKKNGVTHIQGYGRLVARGVVEVEGTEGEKETLQGLPHHPRDGVPPERSSHAEDRRGPYLVLDGCPFPEGGSQLSGRGRGRCGGDGVRRHLRGVWV